MSTLGRNIAFPIYNGDGTSFHNLVIKKSTSDSIVMSLGDKVTGDVYYKDNTLECNMDEYILVDGVKYSIVNPPTIVREGLKSENGDLKGMTKYSFEFYHPMYMLGNMAFSDVAVTNAESMFKSHDRTFSWIGNLTDYVAKLNKNLQNTQFIVSISSSIDADSRKVLSDVLSFTNNTIADALKTAYDTWHFPFVVDAIKSGEQYYNQGKRFLIQFGNPTREILDSNNQPFVFHFGKGVGLKNNSRTPRNNKIVTRVAGYGSEQNIPYGYPQIPWTGDPSATQTADGYPIYEGIVGGVVTKLVKHPFTRTHLMPSVYAESVRKKVDSAAADYDNTTPLVDYYDAPSTYPNPINLAAPKLDIVGIETIKPELGDMAILGVTPLNNDLTPASGWDDTMDDDGNYTQSYFKITLPQLDFDIYACASITEEMKINMRSGACIGCTFDAQVDWDDYKKNFFDAQGNFLPNGEQRDLTKYPKSNDGSIDLIVKKDLNTYGTLMPNVYQKPSQGDKFVILGISMPSTYITNAEERLDAALMTHMLDNNVYYYDYPLKFDEDFFYNHTDILSQVRPNSVLRFTFGGVEKSLYIKQITIKYGDGVLPKYDITLTDNIEVVLNQIGLVADDVSRLAMAMMQMNKRTNINITNTESLQRYVDYTIMPNLESIQKQLDGSQVTYFGNENPFDTSQPYSDGKYVVDPTKFPASEWDDDYSEHDGDMFYNRDSGKGYEFTIIDNSTSPVVYGWQLIQDEDIIQALTNAQNAQDTADGKRRVFICDASHHTPNPPYDVGDLWVNVKYPYATGATYDDEILKCVVAKTEDQAFDISDWSLANGYTAALRNFINGTYADNLQEIQTQIDGKAETWYQNTDPSTAWTTTALKNQHKGDIWHNSSTSTINGVKAGQDAIWNGTAWVVDETVPQAVYDEIDGKCAIYVTWGAWGNDLQEKDLFIPAADTTQGGVTYKANKVYRCVDKDTPLFQEIAYTDDTQYNGFITKLIGSSGQTKDAAENAIAAIKHALSDGNTYNEGGLILSNLISLGTGNPTSGTFTPWAGISGIYKTSETGTGYKGHGIAAWYGGGMIDKEVSAVSNAAKSLFRFDGSGYVASGNLKWDANGNVTIQGYSINATTLQVGGSNVATESSISTFFANFFDIYNGSTQITYEQYVALQDKSNVSLKAKHGLWTEQFLSALGMNSQGGGGSGAGLEDVWDSLTNQQGTVITDNTKIAIAHIPDTSSTYGYLKSSALNGYATQTWVNQQGFLTTHQSIYALTLKADGTAVTTFTPNSSDVSLDFVAGTNISLTRGTNQITIANTYSYTLPLAASGTRGGVQIGYSETNSGTSTTRNYAVKLSSEKMYVNVPWTDTTYKLTLNGTTNGASGGTSLGSLYAPTAVGTDGYVLKSSGSGAPSWVAQSTLSVGTAAKLGTGTTTYTAWGQTYWSSGVPTSISGNMTSVGNITPSANGNNLGTTSARFAIYGTSGNYSSTLTVADAITLSGSTAAKKRIYFGDTSHYLELDSTGFHFSHGVYSDSFMSALGANSSGGGGGADLTDVWASLTNTENPTYSTTLKINSNHIPNLSASKITSGTLAAARIPIATASAVGGIKVGTTLAISDGVLNQKSGIATAGTYKSVTVDTYGRVTAGTNPTTLSGYGITNAYTKTQVDNALSGYLPLTGGTLTGTLTAPKIRINTRHSSDDTSGGIYYYDGTTDYLLIGQGSANLWIGANETSGTHHAGSTYISAGTGNVNISRLVDGSRLNYMVLDTGNYSSYALPLTGGTLTGGLTAFGYNAKFDVDTSREIGLAWLNTSGTKVASVTYHNTAQNIILNPIGSSDTWSDSVGKYSLFVGNNKLTYNTYTILHSNNYSSYALPLSGGTITGNLAVRGYIYLRDNNKCLYTSDTADNVQNTLVLDGNNHLLIGYGTAGSGYNTYLHGNNLYLRYGTSRTVGITLSSSGSTTFAGAIIAKENAYNYSTDATSYGLYMNNSDIAGVNGIYTSDTADNWAEGINFKRTNGKWDSIRALNGVFSFGHDNGTEDIKIDVETRKILIGGTTTATMTYNTTNPRLVFAENGNTQAVGIVYTDFNSYRAGKGLKVMDVDQNDPDVWFEVGGSIYATGDVQASSDARKKKIISNTKFNVKDIASARSILYEWNDGRDSGQVHGGSIAQDWIGKADSFLSQDGEGWYSINYGALALCSAITIAKEVVKHEDEITRLKKEVVKLRERVAELEERRIA